MSIDSRAHQIFINLNSSTNYKTTIDLPQPINSINHDALLFKFYCYNVQTFRANFAPIVAIIDDPTQPLIYTTDNILVDCGSNNQFNIIQSNSTTLSNIIVELIQIPPNNQEASICVEFLNAV